MAALRCKRADRELEGQKRVKGDVRAGDADKCAAYHYKSWKSLKKTPFLLLGAAMEMCNPNWVTNIMKCGHDEYEEET